MRVGHGSCKRRNRLPFRQKPNERQNRRAFRQNRTQRQDRAFRQVSEVGGEEGGVCRATSVHEFTTAHGTGLIRHPWDGASFPNMIDRAPWGTQDHSSKPEMASSTRSPEPKQETHTVYSDDTTSARMCSWPGLKTTQARRETCAVQQRHARKTRKQGGW